MNFIRLALVGLSLFLMFSCGPVHLGTCFKRTPSEYTLNLCCSDVRAPRTEYNKEAWVVFSDRESNPTFQQPGGKVQMKEMDFMEAFLVIGRKGDYLQLVKYDPQLTEDNLRTKRMKNRDKADYYGWVHSSRMLLTRVSSTDIVTGYSNKGMVILTDSVPVTAPDEYLAPDGVWTFKDENLTIKNEPVPFYRMIYFLKISPDRKKVLISASKRVDPDSPDSDILGWVPASVVRETTQRLFLDLVSIPGFDSYNKPQFMTAGHTGTLEIPEEKMHDYLSFGSGIDGLRYSPVQGLCRDDSCGVSFKTMIPGKIPDKQFTYVLNVNGNKIMYDNLLQVEKDLQKVNIVFVFDGKQQVYQEFAGLMNVLQNVRLLVEAEKDAFSYKFGMVTNFRDTKQQPLAYPVAFGLNSSFNEFMDFVEEENDYIRNNPVMPSKDSWMGLRKAVEMVKPYSHETNILVVVGESGKSEYADKGLIEELANANCRLLGYQVSNENSTYGNNFVLQIQEMISRAEELRGEVKKEWIVYSDQVKVAHEYRESSRNVYALDFPQNSMTQGWILFPEKRSVLTTDVLYNAIDTLLQEVKFDNQRLVDSMYSAFRTFGNTKDVNDAVWVKYNNQDEDWSMQPAFASKFSTIIPSWSLVSSPIHVEQEQDLAYRLLLSEDEFNHLMLFIDRICTYEPDFKMKGKKTKGRQLCNCPDDEWLVQLPEMTLPEDSVLVVPEYRNTRKLRSKLTGLYKSELEGTRICCRNRVGKFNQLSLSEVHRIILGSPAAGEVLSERVLKDLKNKKHFTDAEFDELIQYYKSKKAILADSLREHPEARFESGGNTYYWINREWLP